MDRLQWAFMLHELLADFASFWADVQGSLAMPAPPNTDVLIEVSPGVAIDNASLSERIGVALLAMGAAVTRPFGNVGFSVGARLVSKLFRSGKAVRVALAPDASFEMPYGDGYWSILLSRRARYEADVEVALLAFADIDFAFVDCGANYGYWSVLITSAKFGRHSAIAIEAAPDTFGWLARNAAANGRRFDVLNRAIAEHTGSKVTIRGAKHEARSIVPAGDAPVVGEVQTLALDDLLDRPELRSVPHIVLKLDVEGVELAALRGATRMMERDVLITYEDHGSDAAHAVSAHMLAEHGMRVFFIDGAGAMEIVGLDQIEAIKRNRHRGYDFFATRSPFWAGRLEAIVRAR
ncbi:MAG: FkbM family methyltransferase [Bauldia sp.]|nr:FkbM family methyltransferase [Bauldia sp.]